MHTRIIALAAATLAVVGTSSVPATAAPSHALIEGSGSTWAADAINQSIADVSTTGLRVVYSATGSAQGRQDFARRTVDFAVSDLPFQGQDPATGADDSAAGRLYTYVPVAAGAVAFTYNLSVNGSRVTDLRLSGPSLVGIFTGRITSWDDASIRSDNHGRVLPHLRITPVVHAEGSAVSYYASRWFDTSFHAVWTAAGGGPASPYWPRVDDAQAVSGSAAVVNYVGSPQGAGSIGLDENSYAAQANLPVAKVENQAGYFVPPAAGNVSLALLNAAVQDGVPDLNGVYSAPDARVYPASYASLGIIPTGSNDTETKTGTTAQRQTLVDFLAYNTCRGQASAAVLGNAPLPINLASAALRGLSQLHDADPGVDLTGRDLPNCVNPTFTAGATPRDSLSSSVPQPPLCDRAGAGPCVTTSLTLTGAGTVNRGAARVLHAVLSSGRAVAGRTVTLWSSVGKAAWHRIASGRTDARGAVSSTVHPTVTTRYQARFAGDTTFRPSTSAAVTVAARFAVTARAVHPSIRVGQSFAITGTLAPGRSDDTVALQRSVHGRWIPAGTAHVRVVRHGSSTTYTFTLTYRAGAVGRYTFRVVKAASASNAAGYSPTIRVSATR